MQQNVTDLLSFFPKLSLNAYIIMEKKERLTAASNLQLLQSIHLLAYLL